MTQSDQKAPPYYPKSHLLAASGVAALLSLALLVFPSSEVEAKRTTLNLELESNTDRLLQEKDDLLPQSVTNSSDEGTPFAQVEGASDDNTAEQDSDKPGTSVADADTKPVDPEWKTITVASGDTLSTVFTKAGLSTSAMHDMLTSSKDAKRFTHLKVGQEVKLKLDPKGELQALRVKQSELGPSAWTRPTRATPSNARRPRSTCIPPMPMAASPARCSLPVVTPACPITWSRRCRTSSATTSTSPSICVKATSST